MHVHIIHFLTIGKWRQWRGYKNRIFVDDQSFNKFKFRAFPLLRTWHLETLKGCCYTFKIESLNLSLSINIPWYVVHAVERYLSSTIIFTFKLLKNVRCGRDNAILKKINTPSTVADVTLFVADVTLLIFSTLQDGTDA